ncbi:hypothetical protein Q3G72_014572 [Acer saccharum]|nr:hypothetical protein Q3G72_014572 [Acer saccharum]
MTAQKRQQKRKGTGEPPATTAKRGKRYSHQLITSPEPAEPFFASESATELEALLLKEELYDLILQTNKECLKLCKPGANLLDIHHYSVRMLRKGLKEIGIVNRNQTDPYNELNPTSIGHYLGMDVHDSSMVITIEPGLYIPSSFDGPESQGMGMESCSNVKAATN